MAYVKIYSGSFILVQLICKNLENQSITPVIKDENESARLAGFGASNYGNQEVFVHESELKLANKIVALTLSEMGV